MTSFDGILSFQSLPVISAISLWPSGLGWLGWTIIIIVVFLINMLVSARVLLPTGLPNTPKRQRVSNAFVLTLILSWPLLYLILVTLMATGEVSSDHSGALIGAVLGWIFFIIVDFIANWKLFETYYPLRQELGGSDAYANLDRHVWGAGLALAAAVITLMGVLLWSVMK